MRRILIGSLLAYFLCTQISFAFDDVGTHPRITKLATEQSNLDRILKSQLGINEGFNTLFKNTDTGNTYSAYEWLWRGSTAEDNPWCKASNHFHNPLKPWNQAGLSGDQGLWAAGIDIICANAYPEYYYKHSNVVWATAYYSSSPDEPMRYNNNPMDWSHARTFYKDALTSTTKTDRETNFANTFQALGQVMHLLEDMAVPAHVRNDFKSHLDNIENAGWSAPLTWPANPFEKYVKDNGIGSSVISIGDTSNAHVTRFWDTDTYTENTGGIVPADLSVGLAEYTNANFFSEYTIFTENGATSDPHYFPHPAKYETDAKLVEYEAKDGNIIKRRYVQKPDTGINVAAYAYFNKTWANSQPDIHWTNDIPEGWNYVLTDDIYKGYADLLLPRAVGYSAGLLNYFFRGEMDMYEDTENPGTYIIENKTGETMEGTFQLFYDDEQGRRMEIKGVEWSLDGQKTDLAASGDNSMKKGVTFVPPYPEPKDKKYMLVFNGRLGDEEGAVVGKLVDLKNFFVEDWELGFTGRYPWTKYRSYYVANVVDGYADHDSKVLELNGFLHMTLPRPVDVPDKVSFDYYVKSAAEKPQIGMSLNGNNYYCFFAVETVDPYPVCDERADCWFPMEFGKWVHFEVPESMLKCSNWLSEITYLTLSGENTEAYIDNIVFHY